MKRLAILACWCACTARAEEAGIPACVDPEVKVTLVAEHPDIVTPTGVAVDRNGRLFVLENNTHFRPAGYKGAGADRILVFDRAGKKTVFHEGLVFGTDLVFVGDDLYAATRASVVRFPGAAAREASPGGPEKIIDLETEGTYPHNGVSGLAVGPGGMLHFGFGENLGFDYTFIGSDGTEISGGGEGGSAYRCAPDGRNLERIATGFWNPFGMTFLGNALFAVDNDPGSSPPCRLLHVVEGADFGYEFRYGRSGLHPLITWNGGIPGTLPMAGGTGEAPCGVIPLGRDLLVASWADHRIDRHVLTRKGASFSAERKPFIRGGNDFRPVHLAWAPDRKTLYAADWVSASYQLHNQGRLWKIEFPHPVPPPAPADPPEGEKPAAHLHGGESFDQCVRLLNSDDPYIRSAAIAGLRNRVSRLGDYDWRRIDAARRRANFVVALRRYGGVEARRHIPAVLNDPSPQVRFVGIKWVADEKLTGHRGAVESLLDAPDLGPREFLAVMASLDRLDGTGKIRDVPDSAKLLGVVANGDLPPRLRALALRMIPADDKGLTVGKLKALFAKDAEDFGLEVIRTLQHHPDPKRGEFLREVALDRGGDEHCRLEAIAGLAALAPDNRDALVQLAESGGEQIAAEAKRALAGVEGVPPDLRRMLEEKPPMQDVDAWVKWVGEDLSGADPEAGRRIFFHPKLGACYRCHRMRGRGVRVGPDLTAIHQRADVPWLLESILLPGREIAPQFLPWAIETKSGRNLVGLPLRKGGKKEAYLGIDGKEFSVKKADIVSHEEMTVSLMPPGLLLPMARDEIRNLLAFLLEQSRE